MPSHSHCCCHCDQTQPASGSKPKLETENTDNNVSQNHTVTFAVNKTSGATSPQLKPALKNSSENNNKKVELRVNNNPNRPRPRSVAVPNPATGSGHASLYGLEDVRLVSLPVKQHVSDKILKYF